MGISLNIAIDGISCHGLPRESLTRGYIGVLIMAKKNVTGIIDVLGPILRLAVEAHDAIIAADPLIILGRNAT